ncbi:methyltransferase [Alkalibacillus almallahensis]|uniref:methyltransferase n=1 Tax=Alkalibacillus almallahensis TaxID=1379154 RepID=UPI00141EB205|nr:16S rRNA (guanine1207-N2)-methyltransferase [Alkalibacillus almallahensis]
MSEQYFTNSPQSESHPSQFQTKINDINLIFHTDDGVFSKKQVDYGTRVLLEHFSIPNESGRILDVGCGYGPVGITIAKQYEGLSIDMVDINERAIQLAHKNIQENQVKEAKAFINDRLTDLRANDYTTIITNPPFRAGKAVVFDIVDQSFKCLIQQGELWLVVQKKQGAPSLKKKMEDVFGNVDVIKRDKGYYVLKSIKID